MPQPKARPCKPLDYTAPDGHPYKVELPDKLLERFGIRPAELPHWHSVMSPHADAWRLVRMLYGINPVLPRLDGDTEVIRVFTPAEIMKDRNWKKSVFNDYLKTVSGMWQWREASALDPQPTPPPNPEVAPPLAAMPPAAQDDMATIAAFGFSPRIFELEDRDQVQRDSEIQWFAARSARTGEDVPGTHGHRVGPAGDYQRNAPAPVR